MEKKYSIAEAKNRLPALVHETEHDHPIYLLRRGQPVAVLLSTREYERLQAHSQKGFWSALSSFRENTLLQSHEIIDDADFQSLRDRSAGRTSEPL